MQANATVRITRVVDAGELAHQIVPAISRGTAGIAKRMRRLVPKRTWDLHDTITDHGAEVIGSRIVGTVAFGGFAPSGRLVDYGLLVERGTSKMKKQAFARPALLQTSSRDLGGSVS